LKIELEYERRNCIFIPIVLFKVKDISSYDESCFFKEELSLKFFIGAIWKSMFFTDRVILLIGHHPQ